MKRVVVCGAGGFIGSHFVDAALASDYSVLTVDKLDYCGNLLNLEKALANKSDEDIDYSDIPPSSDEQWSNAERGKFYRPLKTQASVRIDADVMEWLKRPGKGYQTRLNAILREAMLRDQNKK